MIDDHMVSWSNYVDIVGHNYATWDLGVHCEWYMWTNEDIKSIEDTLWRALREWFNITV